MSKKKAESSTKKKKKFNNSGISSDIWTLEFSSTEKDLGILTVAEYRYFLKPLVLIAYWNWDKISQLKANEKAYAFDGSGKVNRQKKDYFQANFQNGKRYNADWSASYHIGARYWYAVLTNSKFTKVWSDKSSDHSQRTPVTLASLWGFAKAS